MAVNVARALHRERLARESPILRGWAEIGAFLKCSADTARDYARKHGLPVHKERRAVQSSPVIAYRDDVVEWHKQFYSSTPFRVPEDARALTPAIRLERYRLAVDAAQVRLHRVKRGLLRGTMSPAVAGREIEKALQALQRSTVLFATNGAVP